MNNQAGILFKSKPVTSIIDRYKLNEDEIWNIYYETGIEYINTLKQRVKRKRVFDRLFKPFVINIGDMMPSEVFRMIEFSSEFWNWWALNLYEVCCIYMPDKSFDKHELYLRLMFKSELIPNETMTKIIDDGRQKFNTKTRIGRISSTTINEIEYS